MSSLLYLPIFLYSVIILTFATSAGISGKSYSQLDRGKSNILFPLILTLVLAIWLGMRPITNVFGDTFLYSHQYDILRENPPGTPSDQFEWIWLKLMIVCSSVVDVHVFFTIVSLGYFGCTLWACKRLFPNNIWIALLFNLAAFSFYTYGVNGIRSGLACSIALLVVSYVALPGKRNIPIAALLCFVAFNIHRTSILPCAMLFLSAYWIRNFKTAYIFWLLSIVISLVAGGFVTSFFVGLGFDDRMAHYLTQHEVDKLATIGFRWDFLLYSAMPIILGYYVIVKKG
ncbi:MAG: EpsG family protein, partial [Muribaculaceae bacterium]|nr:EpsG family protein [Muribaculaceae bacterium]